MSDAPKWFAAMTMPRDGTPIIALFAGGFTYLGYWDPGEAEWVDDEGYPAFFEDQDELLGWIPAPAGSMDLVRRWDEVKKGKDAAKEAAKAAQGHDGELGSP